MDASFTRTFTWAKPDGEPMPHSLLVAANGTEPMRGRLTVKKGGNEQTIDFIFPAGVPLDEVSQAWERQGGKWIEFHKRDDTASAGPFVAGRAVLLEGAYAIVWSVYHFKDTCADHCAVIALPQPIRDEVARHAST